MDSTLYDGVFKRKSFHLFRNTGQACIQPEELGEIRRIWQSLIPLCPEIRTEIRIVPGGETTCHRGQEFCILLYSEKKPNYLPNIGYLGEQLDLSLVSRNIGTLWFGLGKTNEPACDGLDFVIMIAISKIEDEKKFRKDVYRCKRKPVEEIWLGEPIPGVTELVRFAPSACNSQPWVVERSNDSLTVFRCKKAGKRGIMPADKVAYYNQIDMGIFLCFLDLCLEHEQLLWKPVLFEDVGGDAEKTRLAVYRRR